MRRPTEADIPALVAVHRASRAAAYAHLGTPDEAVGPHVTVEHWQEWLGRSGVWLWEAEGEILGFSSVVDDMLTGLYVLPEEAGVGIGTRLLKAAVADGARQLWVYADNPGARRFYERHGWSAEPDSLHVGDGWALKAPALRYRLA